jgi:RNA polymerase sigma-70 factor (sigma-E family)
VKTGEGVTLRLRQIDAVAEDRLADLYLRHAPAALRLAYLLTGERAQAEDVVQEAFARLIGRLRHLREPDAFGAYLRRTILNLCTSHYRRRAVERAYLRREAPRGEGETHEPDVAAHESLRAALLTLPERQRAAIVLRYFEDLPEHEIAEALGCRPGTVRSLISRGMTTLRIDLRGDEDA